MVLDSQTSYQTVCAKYIELDKIEFKTGAVCGRRYDVTLKNPVIGPEGREIRDAKATVQAATG